jgi:hypothetical protein
MKNLIIIIFSIVGILTITSKLFDIPKQEKSLHLAKVGFDMCDSWTYYVTTNSSQFCLTTTPGIFLMLLGMLIYTMMWLLIIPISLYMICYVNDI